MTDYVGLWRSSGATFVRGFENGHNMLSLYVDGADGAVPLRDSYAARNASLATPGDGVEYELTPAEGDLVLRRAAGTELLWQPLGRVESLVVHGSAANDRQRVVGDVSAAEIPLTVLGAAGNGRCRCGDRLLVTLEGTTFEFLLGSLTNLVINGGSGNDTLTLDFTNGGPILPGGLTFHGGVGDYDKLALIGDDLEDSVIFSTAVSATIRS